MPPLFSRPNLDRRAFLHPENRNYAIRPYVQGVTRKTTLWEIPKNLPLNQGSEGACVGFGWSAQLAVGPILNPADNTYARQFYTDAQAIDATEGRSFTDGATVLAGAKVAQKRGLITGYKWAFGIQDVIDSLVAKGPVVLGLNWYDGMYETAAEGRVSVNGPLVGGHCILASGYIMNHPQWGGNWIRWTNSWGPAYGVQGNGFIREMDLAALLQQDGEAVIADEVAPTIKRPWWYNFMRSATSAFRMD